MKQFTPEETMALTQQTQESPKNYGAGKNFMDRLMGALKDALNYVNEGGLVKIARMPSIMLLNAENKLSPKYAEYLPIHLLEKYTKFIEEALTKVLPKKRSISSMRRIEITNKRGITNNHTESKTPNRNNTPNESLNNTPNKNTSALKLDLTHDR